MIHGYLDSNTTKPLFVGGIAGVGVFSHVLTESLMHIPFEKMLIVEAIQDIIGLHDDIIINNHYFYPELFDNEMYTSLPDYSSLEGFLKRGDHIGYYPKLRTSFHADLIIINDTHLIPDRYLTQILNNSLTKIICIVDPFDIHGERYCNIPTVIDTLHKVSYLTSLARNVYDIETRAIDKNIASDYKQGKVSKRSFGKSSMDVQYTTNDEALLKFANDRQIDSGFRKGQKLMVMDEHIVHSVTHHNPADSKHEFALTKYSLLQIPQMLSNSDYMRLKIYHSKIYVYGRPTYYNDGNIHVKPANALPVDDIVHHRYKHLVYVHGDGILTKRQTYAMMKSATHLTVCT